MGHITDLVPRELPRTGQKISYADGDDGYFRAGWPGATVSQQWRDNGDGTLTHFATGLMWVKRPDLMITGATGVHPTNQIQAARGNWAPDTAYVKADIIYDAVGGGCWICVVGHTSSSGVFEDDREAHWRTAEPWRGNASNLNLWWHDSDWYEAVAACHNLEYAGYDDWRLPNLHEFMSRLTDIGMATYPNYHHDALFSPIITDRYWTSTTPPVSSTNALAVSVASFVYPQVSFYAKASQEAWTHPVRGGAIGG